MRYMLLIHTNPANLATLTEAEAGAMYAEYGAFSQRIVDSGEFVSGDPLQGPETATVVRVRAGVRSTTDGPYVETKEHLAGYYVVECTSLDRALAIAADIPDARSAGVEVRPLADMTMPS
jgi:hypothetical protein